MYGKKYEVEDSQLTFRPSVYGVIIQKNKVLLSKQWDGYDFPGGGVEIGESITKALEREVKEETGLDVKVGKIVLCTDAFFKLPFHEMFVHSILIYYLCDITGGVISIDGLDEDEKSCVNLPEWISLSDIKKVKFYNSVDSVKLLGEVKKISG